MKAILKSVAFFVLMKMHCVYILFSLKSNKFYIGETPDMASRLAFHNDVNKNTNSTKSGIPCNFNLSLLLHYVFT